MDQQSGNEFTRGFSFLVYGLFFGKVVRSFKVIKFLLTELVNQ